MNQAEMLTRIAQATGLQLTDLQNKSQDEMLSRLPKKEAAALRQLLSNPKEMEKWMQSPEIQQILRQIKQ